MFAQLFGGVPVSCNVLNVIPRKYGWYVEQGAFHQGPYPSCEFALMIAVAEARQHRRRGSQAKVSVHGLDGQVRAEVCMCLEFTRTGGAAA
jgi:hypothetical protein